VQHRTMPDEDETQPVLPGTNDHGAHAKQVKRDVSGAKPDASITRFQPADAMGIMLGLLDLSAGLPVHRSGKNSPPASRSRPHNTR
jgi:hypothetical protein